MQPAALEAIAQPQPQAERQRGNHQHRGEAVQAPAHAQQALARRRIRFLRQVDENARQIKQPGEPGRDEDDVQCFNPEHKNLIGGFRRDLAERGTGHLGGDGRDTRFVPADTGVISVAPADSTALASCTISSQTLPPPEDLPPASPPRDGV